MVLLHAESVNIARRLTEKNEPDFLQEAFHDSATSKYECENIAAKLSHVADLPVECHNFPEILLNLARRDSKYITSVAPNAFKGMYPGQAAAAMAARKRGELNHIQIQRRMTRRHS